MRIWIITVGEPIPTDGNNERLLRSGILAKQLADRGHDITWWNSDFDHQRKVHRFGRDGDIQINNCLRVRLLHGCGYHRHVSLRRLVDHRQVATAFRRAAAACPAPQVIVCSFPTIELADAVTEFASRHRIPVLVDIRDLWPDIFVDHVPRWIRRVASIAVAPLESATRRALARASGLIGITDDFLAWGLGKVGRTAHSEDAVIPFGYQLPERNETAEARATNWWKGQGLDPERDWIVCFFGTFGRQFDIATAIEGVRLASERTESKVKLILCGRGDNEIAYRAMAVGRSEILFPGWVDACQIAVLMAMSRVGLAPYVPNRNFIGNIPNKPIEYMAAGLPVITSLTGSLQRLLSDHDAGDSYRAGDAGSLASVLIGLVESEGRRRRLADNARRLFESRFRASVVYGSYCDRIERLAGKAL